MTGNIGKAGLDTPTELGSRGADVLCNDVYHLRAGGCQFERDIIDVGSPGGTHGADGNVLGGAGIASQTCGVFLPLGAVADIHRGQLLEGAGIVGVGHNTHLEHGVVAAAAGFGPELQKEGADGVNRHINGGKHHNLVVAIGAGSGGVVPVQAAAARVSVCGAATHIGIAEILGTVVQTVPAIDKDSGGAAARGHSLGGFEAHGEGYRARGQALGAESELGAPCRTRAGRCYIYIVFGVGRETCQREWQYADAFRNARTGSEALRAILKNPRFGIAVLGPADVGRGGGDIGCHKVAHLGAVGCHFESDVVNVGGPASTVGADGHVVACAGEVLKIGDIFSPSRAVHGDGLHILEGAEIVGIRHHTHLERGVTTADGSPETDAQGVERIVVGIDSGEHNHLIVAVGASGSGVVPVQTSRTTGCVVVGGAAAHIGIAIIVGTVVEAVPAFDKHGACAASCG